MTPTQQIILITGATSGIGRHAALHLARKGYRVFATGRSAAALAALRDEAAGTGLETVELDVTDPASIAAARDHVDARTAGHGVDVLINNAGYGIAAPTLDVTDEDLRAQYETNVFGLMAVTRAFVPRMRARGSGKLINVSSVGGKITLPFFGAYNSTKYAIESLSDALRMELAPFGVHVTLIEPGAIRTNFADRSMTLLARYRTPDSPYAPVMERADQLYEMSERHAAGPDVIARVMERAIRSRRPRARYVAPLRDRLMLAALRALPTRWADFLLTRLTGLTRRQLAATRESLRLHGDSAPV